MLMLIIAIMMMLIIIIIIIRPNDSDSLRVESAWVNARTTEGSEL